jgi:hypothetical protein
MSTTPSRRRRHPSPLQSGASNPARGERRRRDSPVTDFHAGLLTATGRTQFWLVASDIECAALMHGEVSPAIKAQAIDLLRVECEDAKESA